MKNKVRIMALLCGISMLFFLTSAGPSAAAETDEAVLWSASYDHLSDRLKFSITVTIDEEEQPANGAFFQVSKDGALKEQICYRITVKNESDRDLSVSYRFKSSKMGMNTGVYKDICSAEEKICSDLINRFFPEDHLTESIVGKNKEDYPDSWIFRDQISFHVWLKDEKETENTSYYGKLDLQIPLGWQTAVPEETTAEMMKEISALDDASVPPVVISISDTASEPEAPNHRYIGILITGIAAAAVFVVVIVLIRKRRKRA